MQSVMDDGPFIVGIGGTSRPRSSTASALGVSLDAAAACGARTRLIAGPDLDLPMYDPTAPDRDQRAVDLLQAISDADGIIIGSPGYHGGISGRVKNALDYVEDLREGDDAYFSGRAVGCLVCADGWQAAVNTLTALRAVVHSLRGWNTPLGVAINAADGPLVGPDGEVREKAREQLETMGRQVVEFAAGRARVAA